MIKFKIIIFSYWFIFLSCTSTNQTVLIRLNEDVCDDCGMQIVDARFCSELLTPKGKIFKFDDIHCMIHYIKTRHIDYKQIFFVSYYHPDRFISLDKAYLYKAETIPTPMGGHCIAIETLDSVPTLQSIYKGYIILWKNIF